MGNSHFYRAGLVCLVLSREVCDSCILFRKLACKVGDLAVKVGCLCLEVVRGNVTLKLFLDSVRVAVEPCLYRIVEGSCVVIASNSAIVFPFPALPCGVGDI